MRSRLIKEGPERSPNRSMLRAIGYTDDDFKKPFVGIANAHSTTTPCNAGLQTLVNRAEAACRESGLMPQTFGTPTSLPWGTDLGDGIARHPVQVYESLAMAIFALAFATGLKGRAN